ncbi:hypothetical protein [Agrococcus sp. Ld7]|uniref:hypothetical protein n=1 Tax=Agrococcus sp. Ld7 TaxID=649148 RepID=UPI00386AC2F8
MRGTTIVTVLLASTLLLQGCAAAEQTEPSEPAATVEQTAAPTAAESAEPTTEAPEASEQAETATTYDVRVVHEDADEIVMLLDRDQVALAAGVDVAEGSIDEILSTLSNASVWEANATTQPHAQPIAEAFSGERDRAQGVLRAMLGNSDAKMKLYVRHEGSQSFAHVEVGN